MTTGFQSFYKSVAFRIVMVMAIILTVNRRIKLIMNLNTIKISLYSSNKGSSSIESDCILYVYINTHDAGITALNMS
jgi:hypothetical protein